MTREEKAIIYFKDMRKRLCEDYLSVCPKDSVAYKATLAEKDFYDTAIKALEQEPKSEWQKDHEILKAYSDGANGVLDEIRAEVEQTVSRYTISRERAGMGQVEWDDRLIKEADVLQIIDKYKSESEV